MLNPLIPQKDNSKNKFVDLPHSAGILDITSTKGALLLPRMTTTQRDALTAVNGMFNSTDNKFQAYENGAWANLI